MYKNKCEKKIIFIYIYKWTYEYKCKLIYVFAYLNPNAIASATISGNSVQIHARNTVCMSEKAASIPGKK